MIDFRFHLISLVAVFLALGLGVLMGSVVLSGELTDRLEGSVQSLREQKSDLEEDVLELERQLSADARFADVAEEWLLTDTLRGRDVILVRIQGTDDRVTDGARAAIDVAGGRVAASVTLTDRLALSGPIERDQLALAVESSSGEAQEIRVEAGDFLGDRLTAAALAGTREGRVDAPDNAAVNLLLELEEAGFAELDGIERDQGIPNALLLIVGGSAEPRSFNVPDFVTAFVEASVAKGGVVVVGESSDSTWEMVDSVRSADVAADVTTVDHAETIAGRIAVVLALRESAAGTTDHYGTGPGADEVIPKPTEED